MYAKVLLSVLIFMHLCYWLLLINLFWKKISSPFPLNFLLIKLPSLGLKRQTQGWDVRGQFFQRQIKKNNLYHYPSNCYCTRNLSLKKLYPPPRLWITCSYLHLAKTGFWVGRTELNCPYKWDDQKQQVPGSFPFLSFFLLPLVLWGWLSLMRKSEKSTASFSCLFLCIFPHETMPRLPLPTLLLWQEKMNF